MRFKFTGPWPDELANGRPLAYGDVVELSRREADANRRLFDAGALVALKPEPSTTKPTERTDP